MGAVDQWQSNVILSHRPWVRLPATPPFFRILSPIPYASVCLLIKDCTFYVITIGQQITGVPSFGRLLTAACNITHGYSSSDTVYAFYHKPRTIFVCHSMQRVRMPMQRTRCPQRLYSNRRWSMYRWNLTMQSELYGHLWNNGLMRGRASYILPISKMWLTCTHAS